MHDIQGKVLSVSSSQVGQHGNLLYAIAFSDGQTYKTFKNDVATQAQSLVGQDVVANVNVGPNPRKPEFINYDLIAIKSANGIAPNPLAPQAPIPVAAPQAKGEDPERAARIVRQSSMATAFNFVAHIYAGAGPDELENAKNIALRIAKELFGHAFGKPAEAPPTTTPEVAAQVNEVLGTQAVATAATTDW